MVLAVVMPEHPPGPGQAISSTAAAAPPAPSFEDFLVLARHHFDEAIGHQLPVVENATTEDATGVAYVVLDYKETQVSRIKAVLLLIKQVYFTVNARLLFRLHDQAGVV